MVVLGEVDVEVAEDEVDVAVKFDVEFATMCVQLTFEGMETLLDRVRSAHYVVITF